MFWDVEDCSYVNRESLNVKSSELITIYNHVYFFNHLIMLHKKFYTCTVAFCIHDSRLTIHVNHPNTVLLRATSFSNTSVTLSELTCSASALKFNNMRCRKTGAAIAWISSITTA